MIGYCIDLTGNLGDSGTMCVRKYYLDENGAVQNIIVEAKTAKASTTPGTWYKWKVEVAGNTITVRYNNSVVLSVTDNGDEVLGEPYACGVPMLGVQNRQGITEYDNVKITPADGSTVIYDDFTNPYFLNGVTYKWHVRDSRGTWTFTDGLLDSVSSSNTARMGFQMLTQDPSDSSKTIDLASQLTDYAAEVDFARVSSKSQVGMLLRIQPYGTNDYNMYELSVNANGTIQLKKRYNSRNSSANLAIAIKTILPQSIPGTI